MGDIIKLLLKSLNFDLLMIGMREREMGLEKIYNIYNVLCPIEIIIINCNHTIHWGMPDAPLVYGPPYSIEKNVLKA